MLDALNVARYIINFSNKKSYGISNLRLQKLLYFVQAYYLSRPDSTGPCFDEEIVAWDFGPVVPTVYHEYKCFGNSNIPEVNTFLSFDPDKIWSVHRSPFDENSIPQGDRTIISSVIDRFANYSTTSLETITHNQKPWKDAYIKKGNRTISKEAIKEYFSN